MEATSRGARLRQFEEVRQISRLRQQKTLAAHYLEHSRPVRQRRDDALAENLMADWLKYHVSTLAAPERYAVSVVY